MTNIENTILHTTLLLRRAEFLDTCILALGEPGYHKTTKEFKIGDGITAWKDLPIANEQQIDAFIKAYAVASVTKADGTAIEVDNTDPKNPKVGLKINNSGNATLSQSNEGLSANIDLSSYYTKEEIGDIVEALHGHKNGIGTVVSTAEANGDLSIDLNLEFAEIGTDKLLKLVDKTSKAVVASFDATNFIKDGMLHDVEYDAATNKLTFTWNTDAGNKTDEVILSDILDPYTFTEGAKIGISVSGTDITVTHEAINAPVVKPGTGRTYITEVVTDGYGHITEVKTATETDQDLTHDHDSEYKKVQEAKNFGDDIKNTFIKTISQDEQGVITATTGTVDVGVEQIKAGKQITVNPESGTGVVEVSHATITDEAGNLMSGTIMDTAHDNETDPSFITGIKVDNGHVTGATVKNLSDVLNNMIFVLDGGEEAGTLVIC